MKELTFAEAVEIDTLRQELIELHDIWTVENYYPVLEKIESIKSRIHYLRYGNDNPFTKEVL